MSIIGSNALVSKLYGAIQGRARSDSAGGASVSGRNGEVTPAPEVTQFKLPTNATPRGEWVLSSNANPQNFDSNSPRGTYLNVVI